MKPMFLCRKFMSKTTSMFVRFWYWNCILHVTSKHFFVTSIEYLIKTGYASSSCRIFLASLTQKIVTLCYLLFTVLVYQTLTYRTKRFIIFYLESKRRKGGLHCGFSRSLLMMSSYVSCFFPMSSNLHLVSFESWMQVMWFLLSLNNWLKFL